jgi:DNA-binding protein Fis
MITIVIAQDENKIKDALLKMLRQEGYSISDNPDGKNDVIKIANADSIQNLDSFKEKVIKLSETLYREKKGVLYKSILEAVEKPLIEDVLERTEGNQLKAANILGINRNTIRTKIKKLSIDVSKWKE